ncbi:phosphotransferase enzyme family protein [Peribacillus alkalitolerans]|uniref:phosphotransferase enzyme family protein n=1 Tax=Peribacillus alkalitolerans TaxID=1550385 RepID=UPI0013D2F433|nr:phosphotransferase [Peribacillus alkalitolerans]
MEQVVEQIFTESIISQGAELFNLERDSLKKIGEFENYIFSGIRDEVPVVLRFTHSSHRSHEQVKAEIDWVDYLFKNGISVYEHFQSKQGELSEALMAEDGTQFFVCCYEKMPGANLKWSDFKENLTLVELWGEAIGGMHAVTKSYQVNPGVAKRPEWDEEDLLDIEKYIPDVEQDILEYRNRILVAIRELSKNEETYGLIHSDLHSGNFHYHEGKLFLFDFDDSCYHFFASDIAIPLYYTSMAKSFTESDGLDDFAAEFLTSFLKGYNKAHTVSEEVIQSIPLFLQLRDIVLLSVIYKKFDMNNLSQNQKNFFESVQKRVKSQKTIVQL